MLNLKEIRTEKKVSQSKLAEHLNVSRTTVSMWESHSSEPSFSLVCKIADYFGVTVDYLLGREDIKKEPVGNADKFMSEDEAELLEAYRSFNREGRERVIQYVRDLQMVGVYKKSADFSDKAEA